MKLANVVVVVVVVLVLTIAPNLGAGFQIGSISEELRQHLQTREDASIETKSATLNADHLVGKLCADGDVASVKEAVAEFGRYAVCEATRWEHSATSRSKSCLHRAIESGRNLLVEYLLTTAGCQNKMPSRDRTPPLIYAAMYGRTEIVRRLLDLGASVDSSTYPNRLTPLHYAVTNGRLEIARLLLEAGASVDAGDSVNRSPLHLLALSDSGINQTEIAQLLIDFGARVDRGDMLNDTPLLYVAQNDYNNDNPEMARLLLDAGAQIDSRNQGLLTPLHEASKYGNSRVVRVLIERGARLEERNNNGETALRLAIKKKRPTIVTELIKAGASLENAKEAKYDVKIMRGSSVLNLTWFGEGMMDDKIIQAIEDGRNQRLLSAFNVRLIDRNGYISTQRGRLEVFHDGEWGTICDDHLHDPNQMNDNIAIVVCRMIGRMGGKVHAGSILQGQATGRIWLDKVDCDGKEISLAYCSQKPWGREKDCRHTEDLTVTCS